MGDTTVGSVLNVDQDENVTGNLDVTGEIEAGSLQSTLAGNRILTTLDLGSVSPSVVSPGKVNRLIFMGVPINSKYHRLSWIY